MTCDYQMHSLSSLNRLFRLMMGAVVRGSWTHRVARGGMGSHSWREISSHFHFISLSHSLIKFKCKCLATCNVKIVLLRFLLL